MNFITSIVFFTLIGRSIKAAIVFQDNFQNLDNWVTHNDGHTSVVEIVNNPPQLPYLFTNITQCFPGYCFRSEAAVKPILRSSIIADASSEYWLGVTFAIPPTWTVPSSSYKDNTYHVQLHGGTNEGLSPNLGIRQSQNKMSVNICGNTDPQAPSNCLYYDLGSIVPGQWMNFVVHGKFAYGQPTGFVRIWRDGKLYVDVSNILTSYAENLPPYLILGSYQMNWKLNQTGVPYNWVGAYHRSVKIGDAGSSYAEVYTGNGSSVVYDQSFSPTIAPTGNPKASQSSSSSSSSSSFNLLFLAFIIPIVVVVIILLFYCGWEESRGKRCFKHLLANPEVRRAPAFTPSGPHFSTVEQNDLEMMAVEKTSISKL